MQTLRTHLRDLVALALVLAASILVKWNIWQLTPQIFNDSAGYLVPAISLDAGRGYGVQENGFRTPTYPLFAAAILAPFDRTHLSECTDAHRAPCLGNAIKTADGRAALQAIVLVQIVLGLVTTFLLYVLGKHLTGSLVVASLCAAGYALNLSTAFWEISLLTETLTTLMVVESVWLTLKASAELRAAGNERKEASSELRVASGRRSFQPASHQIIESPDDQISTAGPHSRAPWLLGILLAALALLHSLFLVYWIVPSAFLAARVLRTRGRKAWRAALQFTLPVWGLPALSLLAWSGYNYAANGFFTPSTLSGYVAIQMVAPVVEQAPPEYQALADVYIGYRDAVIQETGSHSGAIFRAWRDLMKVSGLTWSGVSQRLSGLSAYLILADPGSYLNIVAQGWERFWQFAFYHYDPVPPGPAQLMLWFTSDLVQQALVYLFWIATFVFLLLSLHVRAVRDSLFAHRASLTSLWFLLLVVLYAAAVANLTNFQDNARHRSYTLPLQYMFTIAVMWEFARTVKRFGISRRKGRASK